MSELFLTYALVTSTLLLSGVLILVIGYLFHALKKNNTYEKDIESIRKDIVSHSQHMLDKAREKAQEIITAANTQAQEIISQTKILETQTVQTSNKIASHLLTEQKQELEKVRIQLFEEYKRVLEDLYKENINLFRSISKDIEKKAGSEIKDFKEILEKETLESQRIVGEKIETRYGEVERELEEYRNNELVKLRDNIYTITKTAVELAVGRTLDQEAHENLVMDALKEAIDKDNLNQEA